MIRRCLAASAVLALSITSISTAAEVRGVNRAYMNTTVKPCEDFNRYANGGWIDKTEIPAAYSNLGTGREVHDRNQDLLYAVLQDAAAKVATEKDPTIQKLGATYASLMDSARADREGVAPLRPLLNEIDAVKTRADLLAMIAKLQTRGSDDPFRLTSEPDPKASAMTIATIYQAGLGLPDRDFYFRTDAQADTLRAAYRRYVGNLLVMLGSPADRAAREADAILKLETALAESSMTRVAMRDPQAIYHKLTVKDVQALAPAIDWAAWFKAAGLTTLARPEATLNVTAPGFLRGLSRQIETAPVEDWRAYLKFHIVHDSAPWLGQKIYMERFGYTRRISGAKEPLPRWKRAVQATDGAMGEALGKAYVARAFTPESKARMQEMVDNLVLAFNERLDRLSWMSDATKAQARLKLKAIYRKIGYPDQWRDYSTLDAKASQSGIENLMAAARFERRRVWSQIDKPVDKTEWFMSPPTVNAYYNPTFNEIVFPAGMLQPPYFDPRQDDALNYGAIGSVIGHEITHGFDDEGRQFDADGNLKQWWTERDDSLFRERAQRVVDQYDGYVAIDTLHVNGKLTLGENIGDIGGLTIAYYAYQKFLEKHGRADIDGFTPEQRFFIGFAQGWRAKFRPEILRTIVLTNPHSPNAFRVIGSVSNMPEFYKAFGCTDGQPMVRPEAVRGDIW